MESTNGKNEVKVTIPYGNQEASFLIPRENFSELLCPKQVKLPSNETNLIKEALRHPFGTDRIENIAQKGKKVVILCDDITRPTPARKIIPLLLDCLSETGISNKDIKIVMALGTHRAMTKEEIAHKVGEKILRQIRVENHKFREKNKLVDLGLSPGGVRVWINKTVVEADVKIGVGTILPHFDAGWGGGAKIIFPGVSGEETVRQFHLQHVEIDRSTGLHNFLGLERNPIRENMEKWVDTLGLDFIVNAIVTPDRKIYRVVAGHYILAHRVGVSFAKEIYEVKAREKVDIAIVSSHPRDIDFWQAGKGIASGELLVKDGGSLILVTPCFEGIGPHKNYADYIGEDNAEILFEKIFQGKVDPVAACVGIILSRIRKRIKIGIVSDGLPGNYVKKAKFEHFSSLQGALEFKLREYKNVAKISVLPNIEIHPYLGDKSESVKHIENSEFRYVV